MGVIEARRRILLSAPHPVTTTPAPVASFNTDIVGKLRSAKFSFLPVQSGSGDPSPTNVRPISGWDGVTVTRCGKNLFDPSIAQSGKYWTNSGEISITTASLSCSGFIKVKPSTLYCSTGFAGTGFYSGVSFDKNKNVIGNWFAAGSKTEPWVAKTQDNAEWITLNFKTEQLGTMSFYKADSVGSYAPYTGSTYPVSWQSAGTIYGGYVDVVRGEVVAEWGIYSITGNENFSDTSTSQKIIVTPNVNSIGGIKPDTNRTVCDAISTFAEAKTYESLNVAGSTDGFGFGMNGYIIVGSNQYANWSNLVGEKIVFKLATPIHYALTPQSIKSLRGANNMWSNANGDAQATYWVHRGGVIDTSPKILQYDVRLASDSSIVSSLGSCITTVYDCNVQANSRTFSHYGLEASTINFKDGLFYDYWNLASYTEPKSSSILAKDQTQQMQFTLKTSMIDDCYCIHEYTGDILFAGKNSIYYGYRNINDMAT